MLQIFVRKDLARYFNSVFIQVCMKDRSSWSVLRFRLSCCLFSWYCYVLSNSMVIVEILNQEQTLNLTEKHFQHSNKISIVNRLQAERSGLRFPTEAKYFSCTTCPALLWAPSGFVFSDDLVTSKILSFND